VVDGVIHIPLAGRSLGALSGPSRGQKDPTGLRDFIAGPENSLAVVAVRSVLNLTDRAPTPVLFCGPPGTGKSHLAQGLAALWKTDFPRQSVVSTTAVDFARDLADALETQTLDEFRSRYRRASLLVLDDLHQLAGKGAAQRELRHLFDASYDRSRRIVVTAHDSPEQLTGIIPDLQSRLTAGLIVPLLPPGPEARLAILRRAAAARRMRLPLSATLTLANGLPVTVPELFGALAQLEMSARLGGTLIDLDAAKRYVAGKSRSREPPLPEIAAAAARYYSVKLGELRSPSRHRRLVTARSMAMYLARTMTRNSLQKIGRYFGGRDHTTVSHDCRKIAKLVQTEPAVRQAVLQLQRELQAA